ncbi:MAG: Ribonuclease H [Myxococcota bacterium]|nr:Ribonuclease H [Myxococcota bacterium]
MKRPPPSPDYMERALAFLAGMEPLELTQKAFPGITRDMLRNALIERLGLKTGDTPGAPPPPAGQAPGNRSPAGKKTGEGDDREWTLYTDGACRGNPGPAAIGVSLQSPDGVEVVESGAIGVTTNNVAEYKAVIAGLERALAMGVRRLRVLADSQLVIQQLSGAYAVRNPAMKTLHARVKELEKQFGGVTYEHIYREKNQRADQLANQALDNWRR